MGGFGMTFFFFPEGKNNFPNEKSGEDTDRMLVEDRPEARDIETTFLQKAGAESPGPFCCEKCIAGNHVQLFMEVYIYAP